jgi:peroxiredoxin
MKRWLLPISMTLGLAVAAAVLFGSLLGWPAGRQLQPESPAVPVGTPAPSPSDRITAETGSRPATGETAPSLTPPVPAPANLAPLFAALAMHRPPERREAPDFTLPDVEGRPVRLRDLRGKLVFLNFWATWCPPCKLEMPSMERLYQTFKRTEFAMLAVSIDRQGVQVVKPFMEELQLTFPALLDSASEVARQYGLRGLTTTYLIDPNGRLIGAAVGGRNWYSTEAKALIAGLLRQASTSANDLTQGGRTHSR